MGLKDERRFSLFHQVLNRAPWSSLAVDKRLLDLLIRLIHPADEPLVFGIDYLGCGREGAACVPLLSFKSHFAPRMEGS
jgi:hypothetical protein